MIKMTHTNMHNSGFYVDSSNQLILFDDTELPIQVRPQKRRHPHDRKHIRELVRNFIAKRYK